MPTFNLRDPHDRAALGLTDADAAATVLAPFQRSRQGVTARSRADTESLILQMIEHRGAMTRREIATSLHRKKTPWLVGVIMDLVADGRLAEFERVNRWGKKEWVYR